MREPNAKQAKMGQAATIRKFRIPVCIFLLALVASLVGCWWGIPQLNGPTTPPHGWEVDATSGLATLSELHNLFIEPKPDWYMAYPVFHYLVQGLAYLPYLAMLFVTGELSHPSAVYPYGLKDPASAIASMVLISRVLTAIMSAATLTLVYLIGKKVWDSATGLIATAALGLTSVFVYYSHTSNLDIPVLFWSVATLFVITDALIAGLDARRAIAAGTLAGLAVATKDQAYGALAVGLLGLVFFHWRRCLREHSVSTRFWRPSRFLVGAGAFSYIAASLLWWSPQRFAGHFQFVANFQKTFFNVIHLATLRPPTMAGYADLGLDMLDCATEAMSPAFFLLAVYGAVRGVRSSAFIKVLLAMMAGQLILTVIPLHHMMYRYILFVAVGLALLGAHGFMLAWRANRPQRIVAACLALAGFTWLLVSATDTVYQLVRDSRGQASHWLASNLGGGNLVGFFGSPDQLPHIPGGNVVQRAPLGRALVTTWIDRRQPAMLIVAADFSSRSNGARAPFNETGKEHSVFLPDEVYTQLLDGSLGYDLAAEFRTASLTGRALKFLPWVNPPVKLFQRRQRATGAASAVTNGQIAATVQPR